MITGSTGQALLNGTLSLFCKKYERSENVIFMLGGTSSEKSTNGTTNSQILAKFYLAHKLDSFCFFYHLDLKNHF